MFDHTVGSLSLRFARVCSVRRTRKWKTLTGLYIKPPTICSWNINQEGSIVTILVLFVHPFIPIHFDECWRLPFLLQEPVPPFLLFLLYHVSNAPQTNVTFAFLQKCSKMNYIYWSATGVLYLQKANNPRDMHSQSYLYIDLVKQFDVNLVRNSIFGGEEDKSPFRFELMRHVFGIREIDIDVDLVRSLCPLYCRMPAARW